MTNQGRHKRHKEPQELAVQRPTKSKLNAGAEEGEQEEGFILA